MSDIDPVEPGKITPAQKPIEPAKPEAKPLSGAKGKDSWDSLDKFFGTPLTAKEKAQFRTNMLKMIQSEIQRMQKKSKKASEHMKAVIEGRE